MQQGENEYNKTIRTTSKKVLFLKKEEKCKNNNGGKKVQWLKSYNGNLIEKKKIFEQTDQIRIMDTRHVVAFFPL